MIGVVIAGHHPLASGFLAAASKVTALGGRALAVDIADTDDASSFAQKLRAATAQVDQGGGVLILTDLFGGTPSNIGMTLHKPGRVELVTGMNLPMVIKALQMSSTATPLADVASQVRSHGQRAITAASEVLTPAGDPTQG